MTISQAVNLTVVLAYLFMIVGVGVYFALKRKNARQFMIADQTIPGWAVGLSMFGSYISSISFLANPASSFAGNWLWAGFTLATPIGLFVGTRYFMRFYRRSGAVSAYSHLEHRFGPWARTYAVFTYLVLQMARTGTILFLLSQAVLPLLGGDAREDLWLARAVIVAVGLLVTFYTLFGGIEAVVWTGVIQSVVLIVGPIVCLVTLLVKMPGGFSELVGVAVEHDKLALTPYAGDLAVPTLWLVFLTAILDHLRNWGVDQSYVQRYLAARTEREAARSIWIAGLLYMPVAFFFWFIGTALFAFYTALPYRLPAGTPPDAVFPQFIAYELLPGLSGLVVAAIFAASMDSSLNSMATLTLEDGYKRHLRPQAGDRESLLVLYGSTLVWGLLSIAYGLVMTLKGATTTIDFSARVGALLGGGVLGVFLLGFLSRRVTSRAAAVATGVGVSVVIWMSVSRWPIWPGAWSAYASPWHEMTAGLVGTALIVGLGLLSLLFRRSIARPAAMDGKGEDRAFERPLPVEPRSESERTPMRSV